MRLFPAALSVLLLAAHGPCAAQSPARGAAGALRQAPQAATTYNLALVRKLVTKVLKRSYPELKGAQIEVSEFKGGESVFFRSNFAIWRALRGKRCYRVQVNPRVYAKRPPLPALEAILAHELAHTLEYHSRTRAQLMKLVGIFLSSRRSIAFERRTDLVTIERGYAAGLASYRRWIYPLLSPKDLAKKRATYLSPAEIAWVVAKGGADPRRFEGWKASPPRSLSEFHRSAP